MGDGDPSASFLAGVKCVEEAGYMEAAQHFEKAAAAGHVLAMYNLGVFYDEGLGPYSVNFSKAVEYYSKAAEKGYPKAKCNLALKYEKGEGVEVSPARAFELYTSAAEQGSVVAMCNLGAIYVEGKPPVEQKDETKAFELFSKSAEAGFAAAQYNLGYMVEHGLGGHGGVDMEKALAWYEKAAANGDADATQRLAQIKEEKEKEKERGKEAAAKPSIGVTFLPSKTLQQSNTVPKLPPLSRPPRPEVTKSASADSVRTTAASSTPSPGLGSPVAITATPPPATAPAGGGVGTPPVARNAQPQFHRRPPPPSQRPRSTALNGPISYGGSAESTGHPDLDSPSPASAPASHSGFPGPTSVPPPVPSFSRPLSTSLSSSASGVTTRRLPTFAPPPLTPQQHSDS